MLPERIYFIWESLKFLKKKKVFILSKFSKIGTALSCELGKVCLQMQNPQDRISKHFVMLFMNLWPENNDTYYLYTIETFQIKIIYM